MLFMDSPSVLIKFLNTPYCKTVCKTVQCEEFIDPQFDCQSVSGREVATAAASSHWLPTVQTFLLAGHSKGWPKQITKTVYICFKTSNYVFCGFNTFGTANV